MLTFRTTIYGSILFIVGVSGQYVSDSDDIVDDLSFLDVAEDRGENARLCVGTRLNCHLLLS